MKELLLNTLFLLDFFSVQRLNLTLTFRFFGAALKRAQNMINACVSRNSVARNVKLPYNSTHPAVNVT